MKYLIANHKMNFTTAELTAYIKKLKKYAKKCENYVGICVPYVYLPLATKMCRKTNIHVGAQDMFYEAKGPYTAAISATMLKDFNTELVILGHSERRGVFGETDESVNKKVIVALNEGLTPILCVGETRPEREAGLTNQIVKTQLAAALNGVGVESLNKIIFAYEPVWAISDGTKGTSATKEDAEETVKFVKETIAEIYGLTNFENVTVLYGGSLSGKNVYDILPQPHIDGGLVGGASLKADDFKKVIDYKA